MDIDFDNLDDSFEGLENIVCDWDNPGNNAFGPDDPSFRMGSLEDVFKEDEPGQQQQQLQQQQQQHHQQPSQQQQRQNHHDRHQDPPQSHQYQSPGALSSGGSNNYGSHHQSPQTYRSESFDAPGNNESHVNGHRSGSRASNGMEPSASMHNTSNSSPSNNSSSNANSYQIRVDREREGRCADCGAQTHQVQYDNDGRSIKVPLTVPGEVHRGRCLFCHPLPNSSSRSTPQGQTRKTYSNKSHSQSHGPQMGNNNDYDNLYPGEPAHLGRESHLERHLDRQDSRHNNNFGSSASVCTASSQQSSHSIYSHQSAPVWGGAHQQQQQQNQYGQMQQQHNSQGFAPDFVEQYQLQQQQQQPQFAQQQQQDDAGSVYSHASHVSHQSHTSYQSHQSYQSYQSHQSYNQQLSTPAPLINIPNEDLGCSSQSLNSVSPSPNNHNNLSNSMNNRNRMNMNNNGNNNNSNIETVLIQMQDDSLPFETVIRHMINFPSHPLIQEKGCAILWVQTFKSDICYALANKGGVATVLEAMRNHPHEDRLIRAGMEALRNMCVVPMNRQLLLQAGGVPLLVESMTRHVDDGNIQRSGCTALAAAAEGGMEFKISVAECGGILAVMKAVESHPENDLVLRAAYQALRMLGYNPGARNG